MKAKTLNVAFPTFADLAADELALQDVFEETLAAAAVRAGDRFEHFASAHRSLTAAPGVGKMTSMIAVYPTDEQAAAMARPGGEDPAVIHCTLAFLGELDPDQAEQAVAIVRQVALAHEGALAGMVGGIASFDDNGNGHPSILLPDVPGLAELRHAVVTALRDAGLDPASNHGWSPHLTLDYTVEPSPPPKHLLGRPLDFAQLSFGQGDVRRDFDLGGGMTAAARAQARAWAEHVASDLEYFATLPEGAIGESGWSLEIDGEPATIVSVVDRTLTAAGAPWTQPHPDELIDVDSLVKQFRGKADPIRAKVVEQVATPALDKAGLSFDATNPFITGVLGKTGQHVQYIADTTRLNVMRIVRRSYEEGLSIPDTASAIREGMLHAAGTRATLIARTEMTSLVNGGSLAAMKVVDQAIGEGEGQQGGAGYSKRWLVAPGAHFPRHEDYEGLDGQTVPLDGFFDVGGAQMQYPGDPDGPVDEVAACRCTIVYLDPAGGEAGSGDADSGGDFTPEEAAGDEAAAAATDIGAVAQTVVEDATAPATVVTDDVTGATLEQPVVAPEPIPEKVPGDTFSVNTAPFLTETAVEKIDSLGLDGWPPKKGRLAKQVYGTKTGTVELYKTDGRWTDARADLHEEIAADHFAGKTPSDRREAFFTSGGGASGKGGATFLVDGQEMTLEQLAGREDVIWVDPDRIKAALPEFKALVSGGDPYAAAGVHEESSEVAKSIVAKALDDGYSVIMDTTGSSDGFVSKIDRFTDAGYKAQVTMFSVPTNTAIERSIARGEKRGRYVAIHPMKWAHAGASEQLAKWQGKETIGSWRVFDNSGVAPELVAEGDAGQITVYDQTKYDAILAKADEH